MYVYTIMKPVLFCCFLGRRLNSLLIRSTGIHTTSLQCAGHNKWSKIKRKKAVADMERSQVIHIYVRRIISALKTGGGSSNPEKNFELGSVVQQAKSAGVPKARIEGAIEKAVSKTGGAGSSVQSILLNGKGVGGYLMLIEAVTDNIKRTRPEIRRLLEKNGGMLADSGSASFNFEHKALVQVAASSFPPLMDPLELAIEIGAEDVDTVDKDKQESEAKDMKVENSSQDYRFKCEISDMREVLKTLKEKGVNDFTTSFEYLPTTLVELSEGDYDRACQLVDIICEHEDVVDVYSNFTLAD